MRIQTLTVIIQFAGDAGEIEIKYEIAVTVRRGMLPDVKVAEQCVELVAGTHVVIVLQQIQCETLAETAWADEEKETVRLLYNRDETGLIHLTLIVETNVCEVHHTVRQTLSVGYYIFHWIHLLSSC